MQTHIDTTAKTVVKLLKEKEITLSTAESCTGGLISAAITSVSGSSEVFDLGICTYANSAKSEFLGVPDEIIRKHGAVSEETALLMAQGIRRVAKSDVGISVTGIAGPTGDEGGKPIGTVFIGVSTEKKTYALENHFTLAQGQTDIRKSVREQTVLKALELALNEAQAF